MGVSLVEAIYCLDCRRQRCWSSFGVSSWCLGKRWSSGHISLTREIIDHFIWLIKNTNRVFQHF